LSRKILIAILTLLALTSFSYAQKLPSSIRGYKLRETNLRIEPGSKTASVKIGEPRLIDVGPKGLTLDATAEISGLDQDGHVDFLMFKDVVVNGIPLAIDDYEHSFEMKKGAAVKLPVPVRGSVSTINVAKAAYDEATARQADWRVTGTVFVFGRFKKMGFTFKRVVPVPISLTIPNPLKDLATVRP
jgi:hypothetical protein